MTVTVHQDSEFSILVADFIETVASTTKFLLLIWINGSELPFEFDQDCIFYFMQEGFRVSKNKTIDYIFYDNIASVRLDYEC